MAYKFYRDGEQIIHFENGTWDSFWGYTCRNCGRAFGDTDSAFEHDSEQPCQDAEWLKANEFTWRSKIGSP